MEPISLLVLFSMGAGLFALRARGEKLRTESTKTASVVYVYLVRGKDAINQPPFYGFYGREDELHSEGFVMKSTSHGRGFPDLAEADALAEIAALGGIARKLNGGMT